MGVPDRGGEERKWDHVKEGVDPARQHRALAGVSDGNGHVGDDLDHGLVVVVVVLWHLSEGRMHQSAYQTTSTSVHENDENDENVRKPGT